MRAKPLDLGDGELAQCLAANWGIRAVSLDYVAIGGGSHHWRAVSGHDTLWVTVDDLDDKGFLGGDARTTLEGLCAALATARAVHDHGLGFVVVPLPSLAGELVRPVGSHYAAAVYPFIQGRTYDFYERLPQEVRGQLLKMLAYLHRVSLELVPTIRRATSRPPEHHHLESALADLERPWTAGPLAEPAREVLRRRRPDVEALIAEFGQVADGLEAAGAELVITHGEPHPANLVMHGDTLLLIDWDTVALGPPERDLWWFASGEPGALAIYEATAQRRTNPEAIRLYQLRWPLEDAALSIKRLRAPHEVDGNTEHALRSLTVTLENLAAH